VETAKKLETHQSFAELSEGQVMGSPL
jgi:hypothetical protein